MRENHVLFLRLNILMVWSASFLGCTTHLVVCLDDILSKSGSKYAGYNYFNIYPSVCTEFMDSK